MSDNEFVPLRAYVRIYSPEDELELIDGQVGRETVITQFGEEEEDEDDKCQRGVVIIDILGE